MRLSRSQQWTKAEQHDQFCFFLEGAASEYYTLLLEVCPRPRFKDILKKFDKRFGTSAPNLTHQLNFQSATQKSGESLREWADRVLTLATRAFPQLPDIQTQAIPRLCYGAEDVDAGLHALDGSPKTVEEALDRMQYYQHSRRSKPHRHATVRELTEEAAWSEGVEADRKSNDEIASRVSKLEEALREKRDTPALSESKEVQDLRGRVYQLEMALREAGGKLEATPSPMSKSGGPRESMCYGCGERGHFRRECPLDNRRRSDGGVGGAERHPHPIEVPIQQRGTAEDLGSGIDPPVRIGLQEPCAC